MVQAWAVCQLVETVWTLQLHRQTAYHTLKRGPCVLKCYQPPVGRQTMRRIRRRSRSHPPFLKEVVGALQFCCVRKSRITKRGVLKSLGSRSRRKECELTLVNCVRTWLCYRLGLFASSLVRHYENAIHKSFVNFPKDIPAEKQKWVRNSQAYCSRPQLRCSVHARA